MNIDHDPNANRFSVDLEGGTAYLEYAERPDGTLDLQHTVVPPAEQDEGVGSALVERAIQYARETQRQIIPTCPFVQSWLEDHPEARGLVRS